MTISCILFNIQREEFNKTELQKITKETQIEIQKNIQNKSENDGFRSVAYNLQRIYYKRIKKVLLLALEKSQMPETIILKKNFLPCEEKLFNEVVKSIEPPTALFETTLK